MKKLFIGALLLALPIFAFSNTVATIETATTATAEISTAAATAEIITSMTLETTNDFPPALIEVIICEPVAIAVTVYVYEGEIIEIHIVVTMECRSIWV